MQVSASLADFMSRLDEGPRGVDDARAAIEKCAAESAPVLDLQQMGLTDEDLAAIASKLQAVASHVTKLNLFMNEISVLPACLGTLSGLEELHAGCNPLEGIDEELFGNLPRLEVLDVGFSEILKDLPDTFDKLGSLRILMAGNGRLSSLPASLFQCHKLEELHLYGNSLKNISGDMGCLGNLRVLNIGRNQIREIPEDIGKCEVLSTFHAYENCITSLPKTIAKLCNLKTLDLRSNEGLPTLPRSVRCRAEAKAKAEFWSNAAAN